MGFFDESKRKIKIGDKKMSNKQEINFKFNLGDEVKDTITDYKGIIVCRCQWLTNCNTYGVKSRELKDGVPIDSQYFDENRIEIVKKDQYEEHRTTGGPTSSIPHTNRF